MTPRCCFALLLARLNISALCRPRGSSGMIRVMVGIFLDFGDGSWLSPALTMHTSQVRALSRRCSHTVA